MRFAWQRKTSANNVSVKESLTNRLIYIAYNVVWWIPVRLPFTALIYFEPMILSSLFDYGNHTADIGIKQGITLLEIVCEKGVVYQFEIGGGSI